MKGFFSIESIPNVQFLYESTTFEDCKLINNHLTKAEYNKALSEYEKLYVKKAIVKKAVVKKSKKSENIELDDKSFKVDFEDK